MVYRQPYKLMLPEHYMPSDPKDRERHIAETRALRSSISAIESSKCETKKKAIEAISKKHECSYEAAKLLFNNKSY